MSPRTTMSPAPSVLWVRFALRVRPLLQLLLAVVLATAGCSSSSFSDQQAALPKPASEAAPTATETAAPVVDLEYPAPDVVGMDEKQAEETLGDARLRVQVVHRETDEWPVGQVLGQVPSAGRVVEIGSTVTLVSAAKPTSPGKLSPSGKRAEQVTPVAATKPPPPPASVRVSDPRGDVSIWDDWRGMGQRNFPHDIKRLKLAHTPDGRVEAVIEFFTLRDDAWDKINVELDTDGTEKPEYRFEVRTVRDLLQGEGSGVYRGRRGGAVGCDMDVIVDATQGVASFSAPSACLGSPERIRGLAFAGADRTQCQEDGLPASLCAYTWTHRITGDDTGDWSGWATAR